MKIAYSHLVQYMPENPTIEEISDSLFQLGHEHEIEGNILDMEFTPNRGDCLSINGLLRDLAVFYTIDFKQEIYREELNKLCIDFENHSENICPKISFLKLEIDQIPKKYEMDLCDLLRIKLTGYVDTINLHMMNDGSGAMIGCMCR